MRIVCLYVTDISRIEEAVRSECEIIEKVDKRDGMGADRFGYGATHFIVRLGKGSSGARYDDLRNLACEVQVRTVLQDAWAIIDHHLIYKHESDIPTPLQRKLNSLAGLFETADDQFEHVRLEREEYLTEVKDSRSNPSQFLNNEVNMDSFSEYLQWKFPDRKLKGFEGQIALVFTNINRMKYRKLLDIDGDVEKSIKTLERINKDSRVQRHDLSSAAAQVAIALALTDDITRDSLPVPDDVNEVIRSNIVR